MDKNNKKVINAWCSYDIANSAYNLIITTALFPLYYQEVTKKAFNSEIVNFLGVSIKNTVLYDYTLASAYFLIIILSPILSGIADYGGFRKRLMQFFTFIGSISCFLMYWFHGINLNFGIILAALAVIGYAGSLVYYNSFLPVIATSDRHDRISAKGFSWGYAGSMILLIINLITIENYKWFGFAGKLDALRFSFLEVGFWWIMVAQIAFYYLQDHSVHGNFKLNFITKGYKEILLVFSKVRKQPVIKPFLLAFFFFSMGVQTVILVASLFGSAELGITGSKLIITIIIIKILGIIGSTIFAEVSTMQGNKFSLSLMLIIWIAVCVAAYFIKTDYEFFAIAAAVGLVMGGIQSQARSTYAKLIPSDSNDTSSYFSFYDITEKAAIVAGMFSFGFIEQITGSMRNSALSLASFFVISLAVIITTKFPKMQRITNKYNK